MKSIRKSTRIRNTTARAGSGSVRQKRGSNVRCHSLLDHCVSLMTRNVHGRSLSLRPLVYGLRTISDLGLFPVLTCQRATVILVTASALSLNSLKCSSSLDGSEPSLFKG
jgi:hypothetical protein